MPSLKDLSSLPSEDFAGFGRVVTFDQRSKRFEEAEKALEAMQQDPKRLFETKNFDLPMDTALKQPSAFSGGTDALDEVYVEAIEGVMRQLKDDLLTRESISASKVTSSPSVTFTSLQVAPSSVFTATGLSISDSAGNVFFSAGPPSTHNGYKPPEWKLDKAEQRNYVPSFIESFMFKVVVENGLVTLYNSNGECLVRDIPCPSTRGVYGTWPVSPGFTQVKGGDLSLDMSKLDFSTAASDAKATLTSDAKSPSSANGTGTPWGLFDWQT